MASVSADAGKLKPAGRSARLPLRAQASTWLAVCALGAYYVASMSRDLSLYDSGELALAAVQLGLGHPPGQPLHTLLGFAGSRLAFWAAPFGVNLASALPAAFTVLPAVSIAQTLGGTRLSRRAREALPWLIALIGLHACLWEPATRAEVYALATLGAVWGIASALGRDHGIEGRSRSAAGEMFRAGLALGLSASANPAIAVGAALALTPALVHAVWRKQLPWSVFARAALAGGLFGLLPYAYLPLTAARPDVFVWGGLHDPASYWRYLTPTRLRAEPNHPWRCLVAARWPVVRVGGAAVALALARARTRRLCARCCGSQRPARRVRVRARADLVQREAGTWMCPTTTATWAARTGCWLPVPARSPQPR